MPNTREKLIEIFGDLDCNAEYCKDCEFCTDIDGCVRRQKEIIADRLIANGVRVLPESGIGDMSDGYHTFNELYHHRAILFSVICNLHPLCSWKAKKHHDGTMYDGMFIVGINTPEGQATYHYDIDPYWDMFRVPEAEFAPTWDGHTPDEAIRRIGLLGIDGTPEEKPMTNADRIRAMSDEELAEFIRDVSYECQDAHWGSKCQSCDFPWCSSDQTLAWLQQPVR